MRIRSASSQISRGTNHLTALIDVVFLLLIFFMLTLKVIQPEGQFNIRMPAKGTDHQNPPQPIAITVRLSANEDGSLKQLRLGGAESWKRSRCV